MANLILHFFWRWIHASSWNRWRVNPFTIAGPHAIVILPVEIQFQQISSLNKRDYVSLIILHCYVDGTHVCQMCKMRFHTKYEGYQDQGISILHIKTCEFKYSHIFNSFRSKLFQSEMSTSSWYKQVTRYAQFVFLWQRLTLKRYSNLYCFITRNIYTESN